VTGEMSDRALGQGSGGDLGTIQRDGFATLFMDRLNALKRQYRGVAFEDEMVGSLPLCTFGANPRAASIDTPLHAFLPSAMWIICTRTGPSPWRLRQRPGPTGGDCARRPASIWSGCREAARLRNSVSGWKTPCAKNPDCDGILLGSHGLFTWGDTGGRKAILTIAYRGRRDRPGEQTLFSGGQNS